MGSGEQPDDHIEAQVSDRERLLPPHRRMKPRQSHARAQAADRNRRDLRCSTVNCSEGQLLRS
jgi:hypothetical protein